jgi:hypothetical protein
MPTDYRALPEERLRTLQPCPTGSFAGNRIVSPAGGPDLFTNAYILMHLLRKMNRVKRLASGSHAEAREIDIRCPP